MIMKRIIFALTTALMLCTLAQGKNRTVTENDSLGNKQRVIELKDTVIDGKAVTDTLSIMTYENSSNSNSESDDDYKHHSSAYDFGWNIGHATRDAVIAITAIVFVFGFPLIIVFIIFFFRYKNRKAKYRLVEQACLKICLKKPIRQISAVKESRMCSSVSGCSYSSGPLPKNSDLAA